MPKARYLLFFRWICAPIRVRLLPVANFLNDRLRRTSQKRRSLFRKTNQIFPDSRSLFFGKTRFKPLHFACHSLSHYLNGQPDRPPKNRRRTENANQGQQSALVRKRHSDLIAKSLCAGYRAFHTCSACPCALTLGNIFAIRPSSLMMNVVRSMPITFLPYMFFSLYTP